MMIKPWVASLTFSIFISGCASQQSITSSQEIVGTKEPFASHAVYFLMTDRFADGDESNNYEMQGQPQPDKFTFNRPLPGPNGHSANVGYLGGDFQGIANNAQYIKDLGFDAIWLTPIIDNPNEAFTGGTKVEYGGFGDQGKTGFHGYWGVNFYTLDEHLPSKNLDFEQLNAKLKQHGLKTVLDIVANHGSPSFTMPKDQPMYGKIFDKKGMLVADHQNLMPGDLNKALPLHAFYLKERDLAELSDLDYNNPAVMDYLVDAYLMWIEQGVDALRIDTIRHMPHSFWKTFTDRIREKNPNLFMFGESWSYEADFIAQHTRPENGGVSVLDFPGREAMVSVFENPESSYEQLIDYLHLDTGMYQNPYELMIYYDSHDVKRLGATDEGFINANNWLFTSRGIPVVYYGSEIGFERDKKEHEGNRNFYGPENIKKAKNHPIANALSKIANVRRDTPALQRGKQLNISFDKNQAVFLRVLQYNGVNQTALVMLNKADQPHTFSVDQYISTGSWSEALTGAARTVLKGQAIRHTVDKNSVAVWVFDSAVNNPELMAKFSQTAR